MKRSFSVEPRDPYLSAPPAISSDLHKQILCGYLTVKGEVVSVKGSTVHFSDGTQEDDVDIIVAATGYDYTYVACIPLLFASLRRLWTTVVLYGDDGAYIYRDKILNKCLKRQTDRQTEHLLRSISHLPG